MVNNRSVVGHYSLNRQQDLFFLSMGSAIGIGNILVLPALMAKYGVSSVLLTHVLLLFFLSFPLVISEMLWSRWLLRSIGESMDLVPRLGKIFWAILILLWIDLAPNYVVEYSRILIQLVSRGWELPPVNFVNQLLSTSIKDSLLIYAVSAALVIASIFLVASQKFRLGQVYRWGTMGLCSVGLVLLLLVLTRLDASFVWARLRLLDFSRFGVGPMLEITTYSLFSMSVGIGVYYAFTHYASQRPRLNEAATLMPFWKKSGALPRLVLRVFWVDLFFSFLATLLLLPHLDSSGNYSNPLPGGDQPDFFALYLFPNALLDANFGNLSLFLYACLLMMAGAFSLVSLLDVAFWTVQRELKLGSRWTIALLSFLMCLLISGPLLPFVRNLISNFGSGFLLPVAALFWSICAGWIMPRKVQVILIGRGPRLDGFLVLWRFSVRWLVPSVLLLLLVLKGGKLFFL